MKKALLLPILVTLFFVVYSEASRHTSIKGFRHATYKSHTRVVIDVNGPIDFIQKRLTNPDRLFFDIKNCSISKKTKSSLKINDDTIKTVRAAQYDKNTVRVVLDLNRMKKYIAFMLEDPSRLVIDVYPAEGSTVKSTKKKNIPGDKQKSKIKTVVIDPGHGGKDPGAIGPRGLREKDITLHVAKRLGNILKKKYGMNIIYTRTRDKFIPLNDRTEIANSKKADLFVSIHVNASRKRNARGIETYFLNWTNNREATRVAARENRISFKKMQKVQSGLQYILKDLARKNKNEESARLAYSVQSSMVNNLKKDYGRIEDLGVKFALFYVLIGAEMPSALVEVSFISNYEEEKRLSRDSYKNKIAEALAKGIDSYISQSTLIVQPVREYTPGG
jgi:N-acetylmuramoyl-L-alanine amidase